MGIKDILLDFLFNELIIMNKNIDLIKILKDCPKGWKFYSSIYGDVVFRGIENDSAYPIKFFLLDENNIEKYCSCTTQGLYAPYYKGECTFFPSKEQRDWSKFTAPWYKKEKMNTIAQIEKQRDKNKDKLIQELGKYKVKYTQEVLEKYINNMNNKNNERLRKTTIAFLKDFAEQGYENAIECIDWLEKQREQEEHKFKVGDKLIQNKFDPKTLKPFDKVLVRDSCSYQWKCAFYSHTREIPNTFKYVTGNGAYKYCIPYNNDTKHLIGTTKEAPKYYRYWEN